MNERLYKNTNAEKTTVKKVKRKFVTSAILKTKEFSKE